MKREILWGEFIFFLVLYIGVSSQSLAMEAVDEKGEGEAVVSLRRLGSSEPQNLKTPTPPPPPIHVTFDADVRGWLSRNYPGGGLREEDALPHLNISLSQCWADKGKVIEWEGNYPIPYERESPPTTFEVDLSQLRGSFHLIYEEDGSTSEVSLNLSCSISGRFGERGETQDWEFFSFTLARADQNKFFGQIIKSISLTGPGGRSAIMTRSGASIPEWLYRLKKKESRFKPSHMGRTTQDSEVILPTTPTSPPSTPSSPPSTPSSPTGYRFLDPLVRMVWIPKG